MSGPSERLYIIPLHLQGVQLRLFLSGPADPEAQQQLWRTLRQHLGRPAASAYLPEIRECICRDLEPWGFQRVAH